MSSAPNEPSNASGLSWLTEVREFAPPLQLDAPIWMRDVNVPCGNVIPCGERHPFCELSIMLEGEGTEYIEGESARHAAGHLLLMGPGVPHWIQVDRYPVRALTVFFLPGILLDMGPLGDGAVLLRRLTMRQSIGNRMFKLPGELHAHVEACMQEMWSEFKSRPVGWELRLRALLTELLVSIVRWEHKEGKSAFGDQLPDDWRKLERALAHIRRNFAEPIYAVDLARATGVSETRLKVLFHQTLGIPWTRFLQGYRVHQAAAMLCLPGYSVTDIALSSGFEDLGHFIKVFRKFMGTSPSVYARQISSAAIAPPEPKKPKLRSKKSSYSSE